MPSPESDRDPANAPLAAAGPHVVIAENGRSGHLLNFVALIADACDGAGLDCSILLRSDAEGSPELTTSGLARRSPQITYEPAPLDLRRMLDRARQLGATRLVVPNADPHLAQAATARVPGSLEVSLLVMRAPWLDVSHGSARARARALAKTGLVLRARQRGLRVATLALQGTQPSRLNPVPAWDPVTVDTPPTPEERETLAREIGLVPEVSWVGIAGGITPHKNPSMVVDAVRRASDAHDDRLGLALIGPFEKSIASDVRAAALELERDGIPIAVLDRRLSDREVNTALSLLACMTMAYSTSAPNSTLLKATLLGVPVAAAGNRHIRANAEAVGQTSSVLETAALAEAITSALRKGAPHATVHAESDHLPQALIPELRH